MNMHYIMNDDGEVVPSDLMTWAEWFGTHDRRLAIDHVGPYTISTVFLGLNHCWDDGPPLVFESMAFNEDGDEDAMNRYSTKAEALDGHRCMVDEYRQKLS